MPNLKDKIYGYNIRKPYPGEQDYFRGNPKVTGMAAEDGQVVLNPFAQLDERQRQAVAQNEASRLWMRQNAFDPDFAVTPEQTAAFQGTPYGNPENQRDLKHTILARMISGDKSAGQSTQHQQMWAEWLMQNLRDR